MKPSYSTFYSSLSAALGSKEPLLTSSDVMNIIDSNNNVFKTHVNSFFILFSFNYRHKKIYYLSFFRQTNDYNNILCESFEKFPCLYEMFNIGLCEASVRQYLEHIQKVYSYPIVLIG